MSPLLRSISLFIFLCGCWFIFSGFTKPFFLISGVLCSAISVWIASRMDVVDHEGHPVHVSLRAFPYWAWLLKEMFISSLRVTYLVLSPKCAISPALGWVKSHEPYDMAHTTYANSITLTPGTVSVDLEEHADETAHICVHALEASALDTLKEGEMERKVRAFVSKEHSLKGESSC